MPITEVQNISQAANTDSIAFTASNIVPGNTVVLVVGDYDPLTQSITGAKVGTTAVPFSVLTYPQIGGTDPQGLAIVTVPNIQVAGQKTINFTYSGGSVIGSWIAEYYGLGPNPVMDVSVVNTGTGSTITSGSTSNTTAADELIIAAASSYWGTGSAPTQTWANTSLNINNHLSIGWEIQTTPGQSYAWTQTVGGSGEGWAAAVVTIRPSSGVLMAGIV